MLRNTKRKNSVFFPNNNRGCNVAVFLQILVHVIYLSVYEHCKCGLVVSWYFMTQNKMSTSSTSTNSTGNIKVKQKKVKSKMEEKTIELPKALDYLFEKELINKQNKHIHIMDSFGPSRNIHHLSTKFYARHEQNISDNHSKYLNFVQGISAKHDTEANVYGWMPESVNRPDILKELNFISAPKQRCCLTQYGEKLEKDKANARPAFNGLRFLLQ